MKNTEIITTYFRLSEQEKRDRYLAKNAQGLLRSKRFAVGDAHIVVINDDGTVSAMGDNSFGQCNVKGWKGVTKVAAGDSHSVGLLSNGTVRAVGDNSRGQCDVASWKNIVDIFAVNHMTVAVDNGGNLMVTSPKAQTPLEYYSPLKRLQIKRMLDELFLYKELAGGYYEVFQYIGDYSMVKIPDSVAVIADRTFYNKTTVYQVEIPKSAVAIGKETFKGCSGLAYITIPPGVTSIGNDAFDPETQVRCYRNTYGEEYARRYLVNYMVID